MWALVEFSKKISKVHEFTNPECLARHDCSLVERVLTPITELSVTAKV